MSDMKPAVTKVELGGKEYSLLCTINAIDDIQDHFDMPITKVGDLMKDERTVYKALRFLLTTLINEGIEDSESGEPHVEERFIGRKITPDNMEQIRTAVFKSFKSDMPETDDEDPNATSGQTKR